MEVQNFGTYILHFIIHIALYQWIVNDIVHIIYKSKYDRIHEPTSTYTLVPTESSSAANTEYLNVRSNTWAPNVEQYECFCLFTRLGQCNIYHCYLHYSVDYFGFFIFSLYIIFINVWFYWTDPQHRNTCIRLIYFQYWIVELHGVYWLLFTIYR